MIYIFLITDTYLKYSIHGRYMIQQTNMVEEDISNSSGQLSFNHLDEISEFDIKAEDGDSSDDGLVDYKTKYRSLKRKLKCLLYVR